MIVSCPACESRFQVDREQLGFDGRIVRCGKCGNCWHQMPENDPQVAAAAEPFADVPPPPRRRSAAPTRKEKGSGLVVGWVLLLVVVGGLGAGGWLERERIVARFPQLADVYHLLGVPVIPPGQALRLSDLTPAERQDGGDRVLTVRGVVTNISDRKQALPPLRAQLLDSAGQVLSEWVFDPPQAELDAGGSTTFETETRNPPEGAQNLSVTPVAVAGATQ